MLIFMHTYADACHFVSDAAVALVSLVATAWLLRNWRGISVLLIALSLYSCGGRAPAKESSESVRLVEIQAVKCQANDSTCCLPPDGEYQSYYYTDSNEIWIPVNTVPASCAQYVRDNYLDCQYKSAEVYQATDSYVNCCETAC